MAALTVILAFRQERREYSVVFFESIADFVNISPSDRRVFENRYCCSGGGSLSHRHAGRLNPERGIRESVASNMPARSNQKLGVLRQHRPQRNARNYAFLKHFWPYPFGVVQVNRVKRIAESIGIFLASCVFVGSNVVFGIYPVRLPYPCFGSNVGNFYAL